MSVTIKHSNAKPVPKVWDKVILGYLAHLRVGGSPETTIETRRQHLHFMARRIGCDPIDVTSAGLVDWCAEQNWQPETRRGRNNTYRFFWRWAEAQNLLTNIAEPLPTVRQRAGIPRVPPEQVYLNALERSDERTRLILRLAGECGLRRGEITLVNTARDLVQDLLGWSLIIHGKGDKERLIPLPPNLAQTLLDLEPGWAFPGAVKGHLSRVWIGRLAAQVLDGEWTLHTLRARFATRTYEIDHDVFAVQELLGHASPETTQRYVRTNTATLRRLVESAAITA